MFHQWKSFLKRHSVEFNLNWYEVHSIAITSITPQEGLNYFKTTTLTELVENHLLSVDYQNKTKLQAFALVLLELEEDIIS